MRLLVLPKGEIEARSFSISEVEAFFGIRYLESLEFVDWETEQWVRKKCARAHRRGKIKSIAVWLGKFHAKQIRDATIPDITIKWIDETLGYGAFANTTIKKWSFLGEYIGLVRRRGIFKPNVNDYCFMYPRVWVTTRAYTIDSKERGNFTRFINHSDAPNCESVSILYEGTFRVIFRPNRDIEPGEELTYDYGNIYWRHREKLPFATLSLGCQACHL